MPPESKAVRVLVDRFEEAWQAGTPIEVGAFLREASEAGASSLDADSIQSLLVWVLEVELEYRWRAWSSAGGDVSEICLDGYARNIPQLGPPDSWPEELILAEYRNRMLWGDRPDAGRFVARFPTRREHLLEKLALIEAGLREAGTGSHHAPPPARHPAQPGPGGSGFEMPGYEILAELGRGGYGVVYKARQHGLERDVAIKMLLPSELQNPRSVDRFEDEARAISRLRHDNIVAIYHIGHHDGAFYFVLEYLDGGTLGAKRWPDRPSATEAARITRSLADGLEEAHKSGVIHRDIKPSNILLDRDGRPKLSDFGLAHLADTDRTASQEILGTPNYMAPEQAAGHSRAVTPAADLYSLGAVLYTMLTGRPPFQGRNAADVMERVKFDDPAPIRSINPGVPLDLVLICETCLEKQPSDRFASAAELRDELGRFLAGEPLKRRPAGPVERAVKWARRKPMLATAGGLGVLAALLTGLASVATWQWRSAESARSGLALQKAATEQARDEAKEQARQRYYYQYLATAGLIQQHWIGGKHFEIDGLLDGLVPDPRRGEEDLRGFEWNYWRGMVADLRRLQAPGDALKSLALAPGGSLVAAAGREGLVRLWDRSTGREAGVLRGHTRPVTGLAFGPDGARLASVACDVDKPNAGGELRLWDVRARREVASVTVPNGLLLAASFTPDEERVVTGGALLGRYGATGMIWVHDASTAREVRTIRRLGQMINSLSFSPDGSHLATGGSTPNGRRGELVLWDTSTWRDERVIGVHDSGLWGVAFTPDGKRLISSGINPTVRIWDVASGREAGKLEGHNHTVPRIAVSPDGRRLATGSFDATVKIWDLASAKELIALRGHSGFIYGVQFSQDGRQLVSAGIDGTVRIWDGTAGETAVTGVSARKANFATVAFSPDGRLLAWSSRTGLDSGELGMWDVASGAKVFSHQEPRSAFFGIAFSPDGRSLAVGSGGRGPRTGSVRVWDVAAHKPVRTIDCQEGAVARVAYTSDGRRLIGAGQSGLLMIWDAATGERRRILRGHRLDLFALAVSRPTGSILASGAGKYMSPGGELTLWEIDSGKLLHTFVDIPEGITDLAFSPDGRRLAAAGFGEELRIWDVEKRDPALRLGHERMAVSVAYSPDGRRIATGSFDGTVSLWEATTGYKLLTLAAQAAPAVSLAFSPDGSILAGAGGDGKIKMWGAAPRPAAD